MESKNVTQVEQKAVESIREFKMKVTGSCRSEVWHATVPGTTNCDIMARMSQLPEHIFEIENDVKHLHINTLQSW